MMKSAVNEIVIQSLKPSLTKLKIKFLPIFQPKNSQKTLAKTVLTTSRA